jgi:hypothetical protein
MAYIVFYMIEEFLSESENIISDETYVKATSRDDLEIDDEEVTPSLRYGKKCC